MRYDERFHVEVEAGDGAITARAVIGGLVQEWTHPYRGRRPRPAPRLAAAVAIARRDGALLGDETGSPFASTSDILHLGATIDGERVQLAEVDGRFLSSETTESFTGRVIGVYAVTGDVSFQVVDRRRRRRMTAARIATLRAELRDDTTFVATPRPRLSWTVETDEHAWEQASVELRAGEESVTLDGRDSVLVAWPFADLLRRERCATSASACARPSGTRTDWSEPLPVTAGFLADGEWVAQPIGLADPARDAQPALLRTTFTIDRPVRTRHPLLDRARRRRARGQRRGGLATTCSRPDGRATGIASCTRPSTSPGSSARART